MSPAATDRRVYTFSGFQLDPERRVLLRDGELVPLPPKAIELLSVLVENAGDVVDKDTLFTRVWPDTFVVESSLTKNISVLRKAIDEHTAGESLIQTVSKRGYRFVPNVDCAQLPIPEQRFVPSRHRKLSLVVAAALVLVLALAVGFNWRRERSAVVSAAARHYLLGQHHWGKIDPKEIQKALDRFQQAAKLAPDSAGAWAGIADSYVVMTTLGVGKSAENLKHARSAAMRALLLDPRLALAHVSMGVVRLLADFDMAGAEREFKTAVQLAPDSPRAHFGYACFLTHSGRFAEARTHVHRAQALDPVSPLIGVQAAKVEYYERRYERAVEILRDVLDREPSFSQAHYFLAMALGHMNREEEALAHLREAHVNASLRATDEAWLHASGGHFDPVRALLAERTLRVAEKQAKPTALVLPAIYAGDTDLALSSLEKMWQTREMELVSLKVDPRFDPLRSQPRFISLVRRVWPE